MELPSPPNHSPGRENLTQLPTPPDSNRSSEDSLQLPSPPSHDPEDSHAYPVLGEPVPGTDSSSMSNYSAPSIHSVHNGHCSCGASSSRPSNISTLTPPPPSLLSRSSRTIRPAPETERSSEPDSMPEYSPPSIHPVHAASESSSGPSVPRSASRFPSSRRSEPGRSRQSYYAESEPASESETSPEESSDGHEDDDDEDYVEPNGSEDESDSG